MAFWTASNPTINESLATSQGLITGNWNMIQGVLGSSTMSAGITYAQGDILYATGVHKLLNLPKSSVSAIMTNYGTTNNPSWVPTSSITNMNGLKSAISLEAIGTIKIGSWSGTTIATMQGGTGCIKLYKGTITVSTGGNTAITFNPAFADTNYIFVCGMTSATSANMERALRTGEKAVGGITVYNDAGADTSVDYIALGN